MYRPPLEEVCLKGLEGWVRRPLEHDRITNTLKLELARREMYLHDARHAIFSPPTGRSGVSFSCCATRENKTQQHLRLGKLWNVAECIVLGILSVTHRGIDVEGAATNALAECGKAAEARSVLVLRPATDDEESADLVRPGTIGEPHGNDWVANITEFEGGIGVEHGKLFRRRILEAVIQQS